MSAVLLRSLGASLLVCCACGGEPSNVSTSGATGASGAAQTHVSAGSNAATGSERRSNDSDPLIDQAFALVGGGDWPAVQALLEPFVAEWPDTPRARFYLGMAIHKQKNYAQALPELLAGRGEPAFENQHTVDYFLAWCYYNLGQLEEAEASMQRFLRITPDEGDGHFVLGLVAYDQDRVEDAAAAFELSAGLFADAFQHAPESRKATFAGELAKAHGRLGDVYFDQERLDDALQSYGIAVTYIQNHYVVWYKLSQLFEELGQPEDAALAREKYELYRPQGAGEVQGG